MASARVLHLRRRPRPISPSLPRLFSSSSENNGSADPNNATDTTSNANTSDSQTQSRFSSYFSDVMAGLKQEPPPSQPPSKWRKPFNNSATTNPSSPPKIESLEEIGRKQNLIPKGESNDTIDNQRSSSQQSLDTFRQSLKMFKESESKDQDAGVSKMNSSQLMQSSKLGGGGASTRVIGGSGELPLSFFGKELSEKGDDNNGDSTRTDFLRSYNHSELGHELRQLRPDNKDGTSWVTLSEMKKEVITLRKEEEDRAFAKKIKDALARLQKEEDMKKKQATSKSSICEITGALEELDVSDGVGEGSKNLESKGEILGHKPLFDVTELKDALTRLHEGQVMKKKQATSKSSTCEITGASEELDVSDGLGEGSQILESKGEISRHKPLFDVTELKAALVRWQKEEDMKKKQATSKSSICEITGASEELDVSDGLGEGSKILESKGEILGHADVVEEDVGVEPVAGGVDPVAGLQLTGVELEVGPNVLGVVSPGMQKEHKRGSGEGDASHLELSSRVGGDTGRTG